MSERLNELRRQRALLQDHAAWLDREIAAAEAMKDPASDTGIAPSARAVTPREIGTTPAPEPAPADGEAILDRYRNDERLDPRAARRGCILAFVVGLALVAVTLVAVYFVFYRR